MSNDLIGILIWLLGWVILSVGYYIYSVYIDKEYIYHKKLCIWRSFWIGVLSWVGIIIFIAVFIVGCVFAFNEWVEDKLT